MEILFDRYHPKSLLEAIRLIQSLDTTEDHSISFYDSSINDNKLRNPVLLKVDRHKKGVEPVTEILFENGFRVVVLKYPPDTEFDLFDLTLTVIGLWPKILNLIKENSSPFIYKCNNKLGKLVKVRE